MQEWCAEVAKEVWEQKPEFAVIHVQGLRNAENPDILSNKILKRSFFFININTEKKNEL